MKADTETAARAMYDAYCDAVGGKAWNGQPLPKSGEFFAVDAFGHGKGSLLGEEYQR